MTTNPLVERSKQQARLNAELKARETDALNFMNNSGVSLVSGDVVVFDASAPRTIKLAAAAGDFPAFVVMMGGSAGETVKCLKPTAGICQVLCEGPAIAVGDPVIASSVPKHGKVLEAEASVGGLGIAMSAKVAGTVGKVAVLLLPTGTVIAGGGGTPLPGGGGEVNTASNVGTEGEGLYTAKVGVDLQFKNIAPGSAKVTVVPNVPNKTVEIDVNEAEVDHDALKNFVAAEHAPLNDALATDSNLWSADKIASEISGAPVPVHDFVGALHTGGTTAEAGRDTLELGEADTPKFADVEIVGLSGSIITSERVEASIEELDDRIYFEQTARRAPTGFVDRTSSVISFAVPAGVPTFTITGVNFPILYQGKRYLKNTEAIAIPDVSGLYSVYYDPAAALALTNSLIRPSFAVPYIATVYWNTVIDKGILGEERHGAVMDWTTHEYLHDTVGTRYADGLGGAFSDADFAISPGMWFDEDLEFTSLVDLTECRVFYKDGADRFEWTDPQTLYYYLDAGNLYYNNGNVLTPAGANRFVAVWVFVTDAIDTPVIVVIGQREDANIADARANNTYASLALGVMPYVEYKLIYRVILKNDGTPYVETQDYRSASSLPGSVFVATDHGTLAGLLDDDHTQYPLAPSPATSVAHALTRFADTEGRQLESSPVLVDDDGVVSGAESVKFNIAPDSPAQAEGQAYWDASAKTLQLDTEVAGVHVRLGQEHVIRATNKTGSNIPRGSVVYIDGAHGSVPTIALALANALATSQRTAGITTQIIADDGTGYVTMAGLVSGLIIDPGTYTDGDQLYLDPNTPGAFTNVLPAGTDVAVTVGTVLYAHITDGIILVRVVDVGTLASLADVVVTSPDEGDRLRYSAAYSAWESEPYVPDPLYSLNGALEVGTLISAAGWDITLDDANSKVRRETSQQRAGLYCVSGLNTQENATGGSIRSTRFLPVNLSENYVLNISLLGSSAVAQASIGLACYDKTQAYLSTVLVAANYAPGAAWIDKSYVVGPVGDIAFAATTAYVKVHVALQTNGATVANTAIYVDNIEFYRTFFTVRNSGGAYSWTGGNFVPGTTGVRGIGIDALRWNAFLNTLAVAGGAVFNEAGADVDFRVESVGKTHRIWVDAGTNRLYLGVAASPTGYAFTNTCIAESDSSTTPSFSNLFELVWSPTAHCATAYKYCTGYVARVDDLNGAYQIGDLYAQTCAVESYSAALARSLTGLVVASRVASTGGVTTAIGLSVKHFGNAGSGTTATYKALLLSTPSLTGGAITTEYAIHQESPTGINLLAGLTRLEQALELKDGVAAPAALSGYARIYVDTADGDLKVKFADGVTKTLATDT